MSVHALTLLKLRKDIPEGKFLRKLTFEKPPPDQTKEDLRHDLGLHAIAFLIPHNTHIQNYNVPIEDVERTVFLFDTCVNAWGCVRFVLSARNEGDELEVHFSAEAHIQGLDGRMARKLEELASKHRRMIPWRQLETRSEQVITLKVNDIPELHWMLANADQMVRALLENRLHLLDREETARFFRCITSTEHPDVMMGEVVGP